MGRPHSCSSRIYDVRALLAGGMSVIAESSLGDESFSIFFSRPEAHQGLGAAGQGPGVAEGLRGPCMDLDLIHVWGDLVELHF